MIRSSQSLAKWFARRSSAGGGRWWSSKLAIVVALGCAAPGESLAAQEGLAEPLERVVRPRDELGTRASWSPPEASLVRGALSAWLEESKAGPEALLKFDALWPPQSEPNKDELLNLVADAAAAWHEPARPLLEFVRGEAPVGLPPKFDVLASPDTPAVLRDNLKLLWAKWLVQHHLLDEAIAALEGVEPAQVADPAGLLFYRSVALHRLLKKDLCLPVLAQLLENDALLPRRYRTVAKLMEADLLPLKADSLDEVARMMADIKRRLALGRAGRLVRDEEDEVVKKLEKMIEELEKQQQQQSQGGGQAQSSRPMEDSQPGGGTGPGDVTPRRLGNKSEWGNLPPKEREETLQEITKELPAHFRSVIEEYFRKLARNN